MIFTQEIADSRGLLLWGVGAMDIKDLCAEMRTLPACFPHLPSWYFALADFSSVGTLKVEITDFDLLVELHRKLAKMARLGLTVAILARSEIVFGIARMWQAASESTGWEIQVFRERAASEAWLRHRTLAKFAVELPSFDAATESAAGA